MDNQESEEDLGNEVEIQTKTFFTVEAAQLVRFILHRRKVLESLEFKQVEAFDIETMCFLPEFEEAEFKDNIYNLKNEEGDVEITFVDDQWIVFVDQLTFIIEKLGNNSRITAYQTIKQGPETLKRYLKDLSVMKNIVN